MNDRYEENLAQALYAEYADMQRIRSGDAPPWAGLPDRERYRWLAVARLVEDRPDRMLGGALRAALGKRALRLLERGSWVRAWAALRLLLLVSSRHEDDIPF